jgi:two-component system chemotaxis sensor kinase CheA
MNEVVHEFLLETHENLAQLDLDLVALEKNPADADTLARVFRTLHTIKGSAGFLGLPKLQAVAHAAETLLGRLRSGEVRFVMPVASALLAVVDAVRGIVTSIEKSVGEGDADYSELIRNLEQLASGGAAAAPPTPAPSPAPPPAPVPAAPPRAVSEPSAPTGSAPTVSLAPGAAPGGDSSEGRAQAVADSAIRVHVGLLDRMMTLVGELVLARNQILQFSNTQEDASFLDAVQRLNRLTTELQADVMKTRLQPIGNIWSALPRVVRDMAVACGKQARLEMYGQETELDKTIIEMIRDPLTHLVRNAIDHGIELPAARLQRGKPAEGRLALRAFHEGGKVHIEIADDGGGIDPQKVRAKAIQAQIVSPEKAAALSDAELIDLIFRPGFSTAEAVTQLSGRGVGMDVVRTQVEKIGGTVKIESRVGHGTTVRLQIPLTLAIIPALTITSGGDRYAIPQVGLLELIRLEGEQIQRGIERIHGAAVYRLRGALLPLVFLNRELRIETSGTAPRGEIHIVVLQADDRRFGLVVDAVHDTEEIVVKPLQKQLKGIGAFSGATILGDGRVALILDVLGLAQRARVLSGARERLSGEIAPVPEQGADRQSFILFETRDGGRMAIPLATIDRLEEFPRSSLERTGRCTVVQYRGAVLPLLDVARALRRDESPVEHPRKGAPRAKKTEPVPVAIYSLCGQRVGLVVGTVLDVVEEALSSRSPARRFGVLFTAIVQERVTEFLDVEGIVRSAGPEFFDAKREVPQSAET